MFGYDGSWRACWLRQQPHLYTRTNFDEGISVGPHWSSGKAAIVSFTPVFCSGLSRFNTFSSPARTLASKNLSTSPLVNITRSPRLYVTMLTVPPFSCKLMHRYVSPYLWIIIFFFFCIPFPQKNSSRL